MTSRSLRSRLAAAAAAALAVAGLLSACGASADDVAAAGGKYTIRYQAGSGQISLPELASALGYLPDITLKNIGAVTGGPAAMQALATGQVDIANSYVGAVANQIANGTKITAVVASYGSDDQQYTDWVVRDDSDIKSARDLIGKKVAVNTLGAQAEATLDLWFKKEGLTSAEIKKVTLVPIAGVGATEAFVNGQVDAVSVTPASRPLVEKSVKIRTLFRDTDVFGTFNGGSWEMSNDFLAKHADIATELVTGIGKAQQYAKTHPIADVLSVYDTWLKSHGQAAAVAADASIKSTGIISQCGLLSDKDFTKWTEWLQDKGFIKGNLDASALYTNKYNKCAAGSAQASASAPASQ